MKQENVMKQTATGEGDQMAMTQQSDEHGYFARLFSRIQRSQSDDLDIETWRRLEFRDRAVPCPLRDVVNDKKWRN